MIAAINPKTVNQDKAEIRSSALALIDTRRQWDRYSSVMQQRLPRNSEEVAAQNSHTCFFFALNLIADPIAGPLFVASNATSLAGRAEARWRD
jgi:hypothetical protein